MTTPYTSGSSSIEPEHQREELSLGDRFSNVTRDITVCFCPTWTTSYWESNTFGVTISGYLVDVP